MSRAVSLAILLVCALLEAGGDALARKGMHAGTAGTRAGWYICAASVLFAYGWLVNRPPWSFSSLLGIYVVLFFVVAQALGYVLFGDKPTAGIAIGGSLIVAGGVVIALSQ